MHFLARGQPGRHSIALVQQAWIGFGLVSWCGFGYGIYVMVWMYGCHLQWWVVLRSVCLVCLSFIISLAFPGKGAARQAFHWYICHGVDMVCHGMYIWVSFTVVGGAAFCLSCVSLVQYISNIALSLSLLSLFSIWTRALPPWSLPSVCMIYSVTTTTEEGTCCTSQSVPPPVVPSFLSIAFVAVGFQHHLDRWIWGFGNRTQVHPRIRSPPPHPSCFL